MIPQNLKNKLAIYRNYPDEPLLSVLEYYDLTLTKQEVMEGLADIKAGRTMTHEDVKRKFKICGT